MLPEVEYIDVEDHTFSPKKNLLDKNNYYRHVFIERDGSTTEVIRLNVLDDRHREDIIAYHFCVQYAKLHYSHLEERPEFYVVGRDNPWDFEYLMHDGRRFFLEICRIADPALLKAIKAENDVLPLLQKSSLAGYEVLKIEKHFPGTYPQIAAQIKNKKDKQKIFNVTGEAGSRMFIRPVMNPYINLKDAIKEAIDKKTKKAHPGKESTILVLDNLTTHSSPIDFYNAIDELKDFISEVPFNSIWIYTGYYSDDDGQNYEFSLNSIKTTAEEKRLFSNIIGNTVE